MHVTTGIFLLRMIHVLMHVTRHRPIATGGVRVEPTARVHCQVRRLLHRFDGEIPGRLEDDCPVPTDPGDNRRPILVIMAPPRLALLPAPTRPAPQQLRATTWRLPLVASGGSCTRSLR